VLTASTEGLSLARTFQKAKTGDWIISTDKSGHKGRWRVIAVSVERDIIVVQSVDGRQDIGLHLLVDGDSVLGVRQEIRELFKLDHRTGCISYFHSTNHFDGRTSSEFVQVGLLTQAPRRHRFVEWLERVFSRFQR
jgi:hypothetical protein